MIDQLKYDGAVEAWKVELLIRRARRFGLRQHNLEDAIQEIMLDVIAFAYIPEKSNGATEATVLTAIIDRSLITMLRGSTRYQKHLDGYQKIQARQYEDDSALNTAADTENVIKSLPENQQRICRAMLAGKSKNQISQTVGCGWHQISRAVEEIRERFQAAGFDAGGGSTR